MKPLRFPKLKLAGLVDSDAAKLAGEVSRMADTQTGFIKRLQKERKMTRGQARVYVERCIAGLIDWVGADYHGRLGPDLRRLVELRHQVESLYSEIIEQLRESPKRRLNQLPGNPVRKLEKALDDLDRQLAKLENQSPSAVIGKTQPPAGKIVADAGQITDITAADIERLLPEAPSDQPKGVPTPPGKIETADVVVTPSKPRFQKSGTPIPTGKELPSGEVVSPSELRGDIDDIALRPGERSMPQPQLAAANRVRNVIGRPLSDTPLIAPWKAAVKHVLGDKTPDDLGPEGMLKAYEDARDYFWAEVRKPEHAPAAKFLRDNGFVMGDTPAPYLRTKKRPKDRPQLTLQETRISLDHAARKASDENWRFALDGDKLYLEFHNANSFKEVVQARHKIGDLAPEATK